MAWRCSGCGRTREEGAPFTGSDICGDCEEAHWQQVCREQAEEDHQRRQEEEEFQRRHEGEF